MFWLIWIGLLYWGDVLIGVELLIVYISMVLVIDVDNVIICGLEYLLGGGLSWMSGFVFFVFFSYILISFIICVLLLEWIVSILFVFMELLSSKLSNVVKWMLGFLFES